MVRRVAYFCSGVPVEIVEAAGFEPVHVRPDPDSAALTAEGLPMSFCSYVHGVAARLLGEPGEARFEGAIVTDSCKGMERLHDLLCRSGQLDWVRRLEVPRKSTASAADFFRTGLRVLAEELFALAGTDFDVGRLREAVAVHNENRLALVRLARLRQLRPSRVSGMAVATALEWRLNGKTSRFGAELRRLIASADEGRTRAAAGPRIMLAGSGAFPPALVEAIEAEGASVVCENTCVMGRSCGGLVETEGDPLNNLARAYLQKPACPRAAMASDKLDGFLSLAGAYGVDAVVYYAMKFCPPHVYGYGAVKGRAAKAGLPCLHLDGDGTGATFGQARTRIQAFLEALG